MEVLSSVKNPRVMYWRTLKERKGRLQSGCFLVEGYKMVEEALRSAFPVEAVLLAEQAEYSLPLSETIPVYRLSEHVFSAVCEAKTPQGVAAVVRMTPLPLTGKRWVALDGLQDPGNVGTILRTADAAGFDGMLLGPGCADLFSPRALRATMGSIFRLGLSFPDSLPDTLKSLREQGWHILSSQLDGDPFFEREPLSPPFVLVIGHESNGVSEAVKAQATRRVKLPMRGGAESLNAAVAAGIMMYDLTRELP